MVGNHNRLAHAAVGCGRLARLVVSNPLFIYLRGLADSPAQRHRQQRQAARLQHALLLVRAVHQRADHGDSQPEHRAVSQKYRQLDILLIDDIQFIGGKESTQEEFFHTFNALHAAGKQVVLSSDRPPKALATLEERLRSRFEGGLQTDIAQPDFETRVAILQSKANRMGIPVPYDVLMLVAERVDSNIRELEGALNRLFMQARLTNNALTLDFARIILENLVPQRVACTPNAVLRIVAEYFNLRLEDLTGRKRTKEVANARQIAMYLLRQENDLSLPAIGEHLGGRDHSTVRYGVEKITDDLEHDEALRQTIRRCAIRWPPLRLSARQFTISSKGSAVNCRTCPQMKNVELCLT